MKIENRIKKANEITEVIHNGKCLKASCLNIYLKENNLGLARVGISVPTKAGHAVKRNKIKRQLRAMVAQLVNLTKSFDLVIISKISYDPEKFNENKSEFDLLINKFGINK